MNYYSGIRAILWDAINPIEAYLVLSYIILNVGYKDEEKRGLLVRILCMIFWLAGVLLNERFLPDIPVAIIGCLFIFVIYGMLYLKCNAFQFSFWYILARKS